MRSLMPSKSTTSLPLVVHLRRPVDELGARRPQVRSRAGGRIVAAAGRRRPRVEVLGLGEVLADQPRADHLPVRHDQAAVGLIAKDDLSNHGDDGRIDQAGQDRHHHHHHESGLEFFEHVISGPAKPAHAIRQMQQAENPVDRPDARERRDEAADPVDQQIAAEHLRRALRPVSARLAARAAPAPR